MLRPRLLSIVFVCAFAACAAPRGNDDLSSGGDDMATSPDAGPCGHACPKATPKCDTASGRCVACLADADCALGTVCAAGACTAGCAADHGCGDAGACDVDAGVCRSCRSNKDCHDPAKPICNDQIGRCAACEAQPDTCPDGQYCDTSGEPQCQNGCKSDAECMGNLGNTGACCNHACVDTATSTDDCGTCGNSCNGGTCCTGKCANTQTDPKNCGMCGNACGGINVTPSCAGGTCGIAGCAMGFGDCDKNVANGCESNLGSDPKNCGSCGSACMVPNATALCLNGTCTIGSCLPGFRDCNGSAADGCEVDLTSDPNNCGTCGASCGKLPHALASCSNSMCAIGSCTAGFADCDKMAADGCESAILSDPLNCGGCGHKCAAPPNVVVTCTMGQCMIGGCAPGFADCDGNAANGCEVQLATDAKNCGTCGTVCMGSGQNAVAACQGGACTLACTMGFGDCDGNAANGCEKDLRSDPSNCGACNKVCPMNTPVCTSGTCTNVLHACKDLQGSNSPSGLYMIDPDGNGPITPFQVYCDMSMDGGGWTLAMVQTVDLSSPGTYGHSKTWRCLTPSFSTPQNPTSTTSNVLHYTAFTAMNAQEMLFMGGDRIIKFYYPRQGISFVTNYREFTERVCFDPNHYNGDAPHSGSTRDGGCGHTSQACTTTDFQIFKAKDASCPVDGTNSHVDGNYCNGDCGTWGNCPGNGTSPPSPTPNCWFYGGVNAAQVPNLSNCPQNSRAPWGNYNTGTLAGNYTLWVR